MCNHIFVHENGYQICSNCGEAESVHYWNEDSLTEVINRSQPIQTPSYKINDKWKKLMRVNQIFAVEKSSYLTDEILKILNQLPLSSEVKGNLHNYLMKKRFKSYNEVCKAFYKLICINDLPLTTVEFIEILQTERKYKVKILTKLKGESVRKYYWYITKQIEKAREILNFSPEESQQIFKIVFNYYNLIRFKMLKASNPTHLIQNLVYYTIRDKLRPNQQHFSKRNFELKDYSYISRLVRILKKIKDLGLDSCFVEKLEISNRNKRLEAKL
jgi:hypothetical protein